MRDYLAWRLAFGVTTPSTNTVVQPEYDDMRPPGVTNHLARMVIPDMPIRSNEDLWHYLSFCTDLLAVSAKLAACFAQRQTDRIVLDTINEIESLSTNLSRKVWQKMSFIRLAQPAPVPSTDAPPELKERVRGEAERITGSG